MSDRRKRRVAALLSLLRKQDADLTSARTELARIDAELDRAESALERAVHRVLAVEAEMRQSMSPDRPVELGSFVRWGRYLAMREDEMQQRLEERTRIGARCDRARARVAELAQAREATERLCRRTQEHIRVELRRLEYDVLDEQWLLGWRRQR